MNRTTASPPFDARVCQALRDEQLQKALGSASERFLVGREQAWAELEDVEALRIQAQAIRRHTIAHLDRYLPQLADSVTRNGGTVHWAHDGRDAARIITTLARERGVQHVVNRIVKSKSMTSEEIHLNRALEDAGITVDETDLGEWIIQLAGETPSHIIAPVIHKTKEQVAELFRAETGQADIPDDIPALTEVAHQSLRRRFLAADMGISGGNFAVAETGTVVIVTNEGNGRFTAGLPRIHVAVIGIEKVVPTWEALAPLLTLLPRSATGQRASSYVTMVTGPRRAGEGDGPDEFHLVILDNGRSDLLGTKYEEILSCIRCGACLNVCPVYRKIGGHAYGSTYPGPIGAVLTPLYDGLDEFAELPHASTLCGACRDACPVRIDLPRMLLDLRDDEVQRAPPVAPPALRWAFRLYRWVAGVPALYRLAARTAYFLQRPFVRDGRIPTLPGPLAGWTDFRDFPPVASRTFHDRWGA